MLGKFQHIPMLGNNFSHPRKTRKQTWPSDDFVIIPSIILMSFFRFSMIFLDDFSLDESRCSYVGLLF